MCIHVEARGQYLNYSLSTCFEKMPLAEPSDSAVIWSMNFRDPLVPATPELDCKHMPLSLEIKFRSLCLWSKRFTR